MNNNPISVWHQGELAIQERVGTFTRMANIGPQFIREFMPEQHRDFFCSLSMIFISFTDNLSCINASVLFGSPNFIESPSDTELIINTQNTMGDYIKDDINIGDKLGLVGIIFETKRRNRVNGIVTDVSQKYVRIKILQSFGNCPKYIQPKTFKSNPCYGDFSVKSYNTPTQSDLQLIKNADTFFIASSFDDGQQFNNRGADISHRGGLSGFVTINTEGQLLVEDYFGNGFFNTIGNLIENPIANLLFCDWKNGHALQLTVSSQVLWDNKPELIHHSLSENTTGKEEKRTLCFTPIRLTSLINGLAYIQKK